MSKLAPFTITAANLNLADTTPYNIVTFASNNQIQIPSRLEIAKQAGTAYTLTTPQYVNRRVEFFGQAVDNYAAEFQGGSYAIVEAVDSAGRGRPFFFIPLIGFLDSASEQRRLVLPLLNGPTFSTGLVTFRIRSTVNVASGTGSLLGRLYYDEYTVGGF